MSSALPSSSWVDWGGGGGAGFAVLYVVDVEKVEGEAGTLSVTSVKKKNLHISGLSDSDPCCSRDSMLILKDVRWDRMGLWEFCSHYFF